ncbi:translation initiation factor 2 gamma subunit [Fadolivirus algeromassiliense]|jgi:translation initiation factor 2 subunit 3|uniref:protein-synthesizing GTPase n=1 Tax=Fadolivirus FV1/VV64 TaxID=3070911 RepID=A0A7D3R0M1_9VIRU|nr:translation initiation factor 2 gamma subunit [Fadolivirus algeromassiliense]QKF93842.1 translation initiation factor 2 gamma subunit [Fadolivirus FV1/VV64]
MSSLGINLLEVKHHQPTINVGMIGSVSNGKSSITEKLTGIKTQKHSSEMKKNITIKLGYANAKIFKCPQCPAPQCYQSHHSEVMTASCKHCDEEMTLEKHISIVDCPGHSLLMATMLNGTCVMDRTILVESASNSELAPQTKEHLTATKMIHLENTITCLNKLDLVKKQEAMEKLKLLKQHLSNTMAENSPIVPVAANYGINIDVLSEYICKYMTEPKRDLESELKMIVIRSFNINKQDTVIEELEGGVVGGTIMKGIVHKNDKVCIYPGIVSQNTEQGSEVRWTYTPLVGKVLSINSETNDLEYALPGGLIGVKLDIDPGFASKDGLVGSIMTIYDNKEEYKIYEVIFVELELLGRSDSDKINDKDMLVINSNACNSKCEVVKTRKNKAELRLLDKPICIKVNDYITLSKQSQAGIIILGRAKILDGVESIKK